MDKKIKVIWDFRGPTANKTAEHYEKHLREYIFLHNLKYNISGHKKYSENHYMAFIVVADSELEQIRDDLKPQRGEIYMD